MMCVCVCDWGGETKWFFTRSGVYNVFPLAKYIYKRGRKEEKTSLRH